MTDSKIVLVTGGTGFIGRFAVTSLLRRGFEVHVTTRGSEGVFDPAPTVRVHQCDLFDAACRQRLVQMVGPTHLLHLAWHTGHEDYRTSAENLNWVGAGLELLRDFHDCDGRRAVFAGTCAEYGGSPEPHDELTTPAKPTDLYGTCKDSLHRIVAEFARSTDLSTAWGRLFFVYGPGENARRFVPSLTKSLLANEQATCRNKDHLRDFLHVADAADAFAQLLDSDVTGPVNIASGQTATLGQIAETLAESAGRRNLLRQETGNAAIDNPAKLTALTERLNKEVGWLPGITLGEGLRSMVKTLRRQVETKAA